MAPVDAFYALLLVWGYRGLLRMVAGVPAGVVDCVLYGVTPRS